MYWILVPFRSDSLGDRFRQLSEFLRYGEALRRLFEVQIIIIEQVHGKPFNRGKLLNVGLQIISKYVNPARDWICFHDVDLLPTNPRDYLTSSLDASASASLDEIIHVAWPWQKYKYVNYIGGILSVRWTHVERTNGFPNEAWGWGGEDDVFFDRLKLNCRFTLTRPPCTPEHKCVDLEDSIEHTLVVHTFKSKTTMTKTDKSALLRHLRAHPEDGVRNVMATTRLETLRILNKWTSMYTVTI